MKVAIDISGEWVDLLKEDGINLQKECEKAVNKRIKRLAENAKRKRVVEEVVLFALQDLGRAANAAELGRYLIDTSGHSYLYAQLNRVVGPGHQKAKEMLRDAGVKLGGTDRAAMATAALLRLEDSKKVYRVHQGRRSRNKDNKVRWRLPNALEAIAVEI